MKNFRIVLVLVAMGTFIGFTCVSANAGEYAGEFCWGMDGPSPDVRFKIGFYHIGGQHYLCSGVEVQEDGNPKSLHGNAEVIGDSIVVTFTVVHTGVDDERGPYVTSKHGEIVFNPVTFSGNLSMIDIDAYIDGSDHIGDAYHSLQLIPCH